VTNTGKAFFRIPVEWKVLKNAELAPEPVTKTVGEMVSEAIDHPVGSRPVRDIIRPDSAFVQWFRWWGKDYLSWSREL
jgi:hypothetical protein